MVCLTFQESPTAVPLSFPAGILLEMANNITSPIDFNVEFEAEIANGEKRSLYVRRDVLCARSEYYKTSNLPLQEGRTNFSVQFQFH
jgi:hypothetical protein